LKKEIFGRFVVGSLIFLLTIPFLSYFIVSTKKPLAISEWSGINMAFIQVADSRGNLIDAGELNSIKQTLSENNIASMTFSFSESVEADIVSDINQFCTNIEDNNRIAVLSFDYLLPYLVFDCSQRSKIVYGYALETNTDKKFTLFEKLVLSTKLFLKI
jgi:hypothetical protein